MLTLAFAPLLACVPAQPEGPVAPPPAQELSADEDFESPMDLLRSIERGRFAELAELTEEIERARLPAPVTIEFVSGTRVPEDQEDEIAELARTLTGDRRLEVDLVGCSDPPGSAQLNQRISQERAESVAARLRELGVVPRQLGDVEGRGEDCETQERMVRVLPRFDEDAPAQLDVGESEGEPAAQGDA